MDDQPPNHVKASYVPRLQQCFLSWLAANTHRFIANPVVTDRTERMIELSLSGSSPTITARLTVNQLLAETGGTVLVCYDLPRKNTGYTCGLISPSYTRVDNTDEDMWSRYFERFLAWANRQLGSRV